VAAYRGLSGGHQAYQRRQRGLSRAEALDTRILVDVLRGEAVALAWLERL
jgi:hypothetical protein